MWKRSTKVTKPVEHQTYMRNMKRWDSNWRLSSIKAEIQSVTKATWLKKNKKQLTSIRQHLVTFTEIKRPVSNAKSPLHSNLLPQVLMEADCTWKFKREKEN